MTAVTLRQEIEELYTDYADAIDHGDLEAWSKFFVEPCLYKIQTAENFARGLPLGMMYCDGLGMIRDRALSSSRLNVYAPRRWRHMVSGIRVLSDGDPIRARANFLVVETILDRSTQIIAAGWFQDLLVRSANVLRFRERICICDNAVVPGSIVFPI